MPDESTDAPLTAELAAHAPLLRVLRLTRNVTRAAQELGIPQPTASRRLAALGERLGAPVIVPEGRGIRLTRAGELLAEAADRALDVLAGGVRQVREEIDPERGHVELGFLHLLGRSLVPGLLRDFRAAYPHARFSLVQGSRQEIVDRLRAGTIDLALVAPPPEEADVEAVTLAEEELFVSVPAGHRLAGRRLVRMTDLADEDFVMLEHGYGLRTITDDLCRRAGFTPTIAFEGQESDTVRGLVAAGLGVALLPKFEPGTPAGVAEVPLAPRVTRAIGLVWPVGYPLPPAVAAFRNFVRERAQVP
ncbi:LysR family transcriptional regulator [Prauserella sp. PE36]|uniref:LysR family transcriptional regulator n=1 Tax=Prauserella endophytica TaxID=1592324 RepID=A0ABY2RXB4_9PSEU|nr:MULTISPECIES: LysR family transcriptional regulator [Prauserella]PXY19858.1 LysR family transcriptional regulator [Prauserella coralliicola]RBM23217.1 LysR family transcriptional regulator [Prauserella sp. PE36]TKG64315.1 LysR family transcriptional regulator [Prauserella endophytica]